MKARTYKKLLRLNQDEQERLRYLSKSTGLNQEQVLRKVLMDAPLLERPTADYIKMSRQIAALGNNLNQLAHIANASGKVSNTDLLTAKQIMEQIWSLLPFVYVHSAGSAAAGGFCGGKHTIRGHIVFEKLCRRVLRGCGHCTGLRDLLSICRYADCDRRRGNHYCVELSCRNSFLYARIGWPYQRL